ncbi:MAG: class I SAM-dependent methyltransferase [bacterium]|nr:class I SAM-dependent methyltransferase [bacterium]
MPQTTFQTFDWYDTPLYYDLVFDVDTHEQADFLEALHAEYARGSGKRRVLEPACGSGRLMSELAARGWSVAGNDLSQPMLDFARERLAASGYAGQLTRADMADFKTRGKFDLAHCLVSTFKYLLTEDAARGHLESVARALRPGGIYVLGFHLTDYARSKRSRERWVVEEDGTRVVCNIQGWPADKKKRTERVRSRLVVTEDGTERRSETEWDFRTYDLRQVRRLLASVPALEHVATYDFHYDMGGERELDAELEDAIFVLRIR